MWKFAEPITYIRSDGSLRVAVGATATIFEADTATLATLYEDDETTTKSNPLVADAAGLVECKLANGTYDIVFSNGSSSQTVAGLIAFDPAGGGTYDPTNVAITGGTINGVTIGNATPPSGVMVNLQVTGNFSNKP